jgi:hypothetical protein
MTSFEGAYGLTANMLSSRNLFAPVDIGKSGGAVQGLAASTLFLEK